MTGHLTTWVTVLVTLLSHETAHACFDSEGNFTCEKTWYFWLSIFAGFLLLFVIIVCLVNHCCKKNNADNIATPRVLSAIERQKRRRIRPVSNTSQTWYTDSESQPVSTSAAHQSQGHSANQAWRQSNTANQTTTSHVITTYPMGQPQTTSVTVNRTYF